MTAATNLEIQLIKEKIKALLPKSSELPDFNFSTDFIQAFEKLSLQQTDICKNMLEFSRIQREEKINSLQQKIEQTDNKITQIKEDYTPLQKNIFSACAPEISAKYISDALRP